MNSFQILTGVWFLALLIVAKPNAALIVSIGNYAAALLVCLAMDLGAIDRDGATLSMMICDLAAGAALVARPGFSRVMAATFGITSLLHALNLGFGVSVNATFAVVYAVNVVQLGALTIGSLGTPGRRRRRFLPRFRSSAPFMAAQVRDLEGGQIAHGVSVPQVSGEN